MSIKDWPGGYIKPVPPTPAGPYEDGAADGVWTLDQVAYWIKQGLWPTAGLKKYFIEDVFSTYIYTGTGSSQTITNGIDLSGQGGLVWVKSRSIATTNVLVDTNRGAGKPIYSNSTSPQDNYTGFSVSAFNSTGFTVTENAFADYSVNKSGETYASWTFEQAPKFFDVVTYTGNLVAGTTINHNLQSTPGFMLVKRTDTTGGWIALHRQGFNGSWGFRRLDNTSAFLDSTAYPTYFGNNTIFIAPTSTNFTIGTNADLNASGGTYVAYLFAHNAGGFGDDGSQNVITCGSYTIDGSGNASVNLGWEPQWILYKKTNSTSNWFISDNMRGFNAVSSVALYPNLSNAEDAGYAKKVNATGFTTSGETSGDTWIYVAIRRGPMRTPTTGTSVYEAYYSTTNIANQTNGSLPAVDFVMQTQAPTPLGGYNWTTFDRLRGNDRYLLTDSNVAESTASSVSFTAGQLGERNSTWFSAGGIGYNIKRAPGFMDVVCYTGTGSARTVTHNLGVAPELMIVKDRSGVRNWFVWVNGFGVTDYLELNNDLSKQTGANIWNSTAPTSTVFSVNGVTNTSTNNFVAYLFATLSGVSKVGTYTGNGTNQTINCGFTTGARFVLIKRTDSTGNWVVFDYARGIVSGNDPYLTLNTTDAQVSTKDAVDTDNTGFVVNETTGPNINTNGASYIFLAIS